MRSPLAVLIALAALPALVTQRAAAQPADAAAPPRPASLGLFVYPGSGQDAARQGRDESECYGWARQQTGIDPTAPPKQVEAAEVKRGDTVKGAAGGAVVGTAVGAIVGETGEGAAVGAVAGAARGRRARKQAQKQAKEEAKQATVALDTQTKETFKKAWGACLEGRGYSVK
jgi:hypothetical protein